jgi:hypothetical protein
MSRLPASPQRGQTLVLFAASLIVLLLMTGLVIDAGYAFAQRRSAQNAADFAAFAGSRIVGESFTGKPAGAGTGENVLKAIQSVLAANHAQLVNAQYINAAGAPAGTVVTGSIPPSAAGVVVNASTAWRPFFLGIMGVTSWSAGAEATAMTKGTAAGRILPIGIQRDAFNLLTPCRVDEGCSPEDLTPGTRIQPGQFGWLSFGADPKKCDDAPGYGLGMLPEGCEVNQGFLQNEIDPAGSSHGCCTTVSGDPFPYIQGLTGNEWGNLSYYIDNRIPVWVPIWDVTTSNGSNAYYHIVGFAAVLLTSSGDGTEHAKWLEGVRLADVGGTPNAYGLIGVTGEVYLVH